MYEFRTLLDRFWVTRAEGRAMARGTPGNPAPVPTSTTVPEDRPARGMRDRLSSRWSPANALGSVMAVRFIIRFRSRTSPAKASSLPHSAGSRPRAARPAVSAALIASISGGPGSPPAAAPP